MAEDCERCRWWSEQGLSPRCPPHDGEWADELLALGEADRAKAQQDYLLFGMAVIRTKDDGSVEHVPLTDFYEAKSE